MNAETTPNAESVRPRLRLPDRIGIDADGFGWRRWDDQDHWSMVPNNPDNSPIPQPVTWFVPEQRYVQIGWRSLTTGQMCDCSPCDMSPHANSEPVYIKAQNDGSGGESQS